MPLAEIPPWIGASASQFGSAAGEGARLDIERQKLAVDTAQAAQQMQMKKQMAQAELDQSDQQLQVRKQQLEMEHQKSMMGLQLKTQAAQKKLQAQQQYQQLVASGVSASDAMLQIGPMLGENATSLAGAFRDEASRRSAALPPQFAKSPNGSEWVNWGGHVAQAKAPEEAWEVVKEDDSGVILRKNNGDVKRVDYAPKGSGGNSSKDEAMSFRYESSKQKLLNSSSIMSELYNRGTNPNDIKDEKQRAAYKNFKGKVDGYDKRIAELRGESGDDSPDNQPEAGSENPIKILSVTQRQ